MRKFDLGSGHMGNGISVWNRNREVHGDYEKIAHISPNREIKYYVKKLPEEVINYVEKCSKSNPSVSATQPEKKVFYNE